MRGESRTSTARLASSIGLWITLSALASITATVLDALLLERDRGLFGGGFLAAQQLATLTERGAFILVSILTDFAFTSPLIALILAVTRRAALGAVASAFLALTIALTPIVVNDFLSYQLAGFLGRAFDLSLMFDLVHGDLREFVAVAGGHLQTPIWLAIALGSVVTIVTWTLHRYVPGLQPTPNGSWRISVRQAAVWWPACLVIMAAAQLHHPAIDTGLRWKPTGKFLGLLVTKLTDFDGDGYGLLQQPPDTAPLDARIHPYAIEVPGNGIDENGVAGDLPLAEARYTEPPSHAPSWRHRPDVVVIFLESVRADVFGAIFNGKSVTPTLDRLARQGVASSHAYSQNGYTVQSRYHFLTGTMANLRGGTSLFDDFHANGYQTAYISGQDDSFGGPEFGVGLEHVDLFYDARNEPERRYTEYATPGSLGLPSTVVEEQIVKYLGRGDPRPLFLYVNFSDTHFPYHHYLMDPLVSDITLVRDARTTKTSGAMITPERRDDVWAMYVNAVANVDRAIGNVVDAVTRARGRPPAVLVTSDHGESLFEEGFIGHGYNLNDAQTRIPFVVAGLPMAVVEPVGQTDVRDLLWSALDSPDGSRPPQLIPDANRKILQYTGKVDRPSMIGFRRLYDATVYDFRTGSGTYDDAAGASAPDDPDLTQLLHYWESILVAAAAAKP